MSSPSRTKRLLAPLMNRNPDLTYVKDWVVLTPINHVFRAIALDRTSIKDVFRPVWTLTDMLFLQPTPGIDDFVFYYHLGGDKLLSEFDETTQSQMLCDEIERGTLRFLRSVDSFEKYYLQRMHSLRTITHWPVMQFRLELAVGHFDIARFLAQRNREEWFSDKPLRNDVDKAGNERTRRLVTLLDAEDHAGIAALLHEWRAREASGKYRQRTE
jgi:hypothetical protein